MSSVVLFSVVMICMLGGAAGYAIFKRNIHIWLPHYLMHQVMTGSKAFAASEPVHVLFCFVDHFEPGWNNADLSTETARVKGWLEKYPLIARDFVDSDGCHPRHTWFYPPHYFREEHILDLITLCKMGFGEIEMHLHHSRMNPFPDTSETLRDKILGCINLYSKYGIFRTRIHGKAQTRYAFIHGDWALDNSREPYCGVNDEISILGETGCYADFTFPSYMVDSQPRMVNSIYYATDDPYLPKSYNKGRLVEVGGTADGDLMMIQGPLGFRWKGRNRWFLPAVDDGEISQSNPPTAERVDFWVRTRIHVRGRLNWVMVKVFTHGASLSEHAVLLGEPIRRMHSYLKNQYGDSDRFQLHYVTARELYNIIKAAEDGHSGNPGDYRDYLIEPYEYTNG